MKKNAYGHYLMEYEGFKIYLPDKESLLDKLYISHLVGVKGGRTITAKGAESLRLKIELQLFDDKNNPAN